MCSLSLVPVQVSIRKILLLVLLYLGSYDGGCSQHSCVQELRGALLGEGLLFLLYSCTSRLVQSGAFPEAGKKRKSLPKYPHEPEMKSPPLVGLIWQYPNMGTNLFRSKRKFLP